MNLLFCPGRSTPRRPPSLIHNSATLCIQPVPSFLSRCGSSLVLSPHNPPTQLPQRDPTPPSQFLLSCIRILLPGRDRTIPARGRVGGRLGRRRPSLRLTRIHLPRPPLRGSAAHQPALPNTPHSRRHTPNTTHRRPGSTPHIRRPLQTRLPHPHRQLFSTRPRDRTGLQFGQTIPRGSMQRDRNLIHHQIKRHPLRRLHTHKHRSEQQRTHPLRSSQLQPRHLDIRPPLRLGKLPPIHRRQTQNATNIALTNTPSHTNTSPAPAKSADQSPTTPRPRHAATASPGTKRRLLPPRPRRLRVSPAPSRNTATPSGITSTPTIWVPGKSDADSAASSIVSTESPLPRTVPVVAYESPRWAARPASAGFRPPGATSTSDPGPGPPTPTHPHRYCRTA